MEGVLEEIRFLADSPNRVRVLGALADGAETRRDVQEETEVARSTASRALSDAEDRGWVDSEGSRYWTTPRGEARLAAFDEYVATTEGMRHLGEAVDWLPEPARTLDYRHFRDARVTTPSEDNPTAPFDRGLELVREADEYRGLTQNSLPRYMAVVRDRVAAGELAFEAVLPRAFVESVRADAERFARWRDVADGVWLSDRPVPLNVHVVDGTALVWLCDEDHEGEEVLVKGLLESGAPAVVSWAESLFEEYRAAAEPMAEADRRT
jgi:predicted transcriptional regulator